MKLARPLFLIVLAKLTLICSSGYAQRVIWFKDQYSPSIPYGKDKELKYFVEQIMVYPNAAIEEQIQGEVFVNYIVNNKGHVTKRQCNKDAHPLLRQEALRIFDRILWEPNDRAPGNILMEKIQFNFSVNRYKRLVKKRGYNELPYADGLEVDTSARFFTINQVDEAPKIKNYASINEFVRVNFKYPSIALQREISGRVTVEFIIEPYGMVSNIRLIEAVAGGCNEETIRLVKTIDWEPGKKNGMAVRTLYRYQLNFVHPGGSMN